MHERRGRLITIEELDIIVEASIEPAVKEIKRLIPEVKKQLSSIQQEFNNLNIKDITAKVNMESVKKELKKAKKEIKDTFNPDDLSGMTINGKPFKIKNIKGYSNEAMKLHGHIKGIKKSEEEIGNIKPPKTIDEYKRKLNELYEQWAQGKISYDDIQKFKNNNNSKLKQEEINPSENSLNIWEMLKQKIQQIRPAIERYKQSLNTGNSSKELELVKYKISEIEEKLEKAKNGEIHLSTKEIIQAEGELERLNKKKEKMEKGRKQ